jgi:hypothetical protein
MALVVTMAFGSNPAGTLQIERIDPLSDKKDSYRYTVRFSTDDWAGEPKSIMVAFKQRYSDGMLALIGKAISTLVKWFPEIKSAYIGVPRNRIKCRRCGRVLWSKHRHHFISCRCGAVAIDGGYDYCKRSGNPEDMEEVKEKWQSGLNLGKKSGVQSVAKPSPVQKTKSIQPTSTSTRTRKASTCASAATKSTSKRSTKPVATTTNKVIDSFITSGVAERVMQAAISGYIANAKKRKHRNG